MRSGYQTLPYHADGAAFVQQSRAFLSMRFMLKATQTRSTEPSRLIHAKKLIKQQL